MKGCSRRSSEVGPVQSHKDVDVASMKGCSRRSSERYTPESVDVKSWKPR